ncbi:hypothetical protein WA538_001108, partial [Blastocystis sp. DL]
MLVNRSRSDHLYYEEGSTPNVLVPKGNEGSIGAYIGSQVQPRDGYRDDDYEYDYEYYDDTDSEGSEEESYMKRAPGRIYGETTDENGLPLDGTDYEAHMKAAGPGVFIAPGGAVREITEDEIHIDDELLSEEYRKKQLPKAVNLKYEEVDPELLAAMDAIDEEDWENDSQNEEGYIPDDFIQQAIEDKGADDFDFDAHIRNLLRQREEREKSHVALTEDRYAAEIQREEGDQHDDGTQHDDRPIDRQFDIVLGQYDEEDDDEEHGGISLHDAVFQDALDEFLEEEAAHAKEDREAWMHGNTGGPSRSYEQIIAEEAHPEEKTTPRAESELEEEEEEVGELIDRAFARPERDDMDCESICSTYSNVLNHPKVIMAPRKVKRIDISKKTGMPIVEKEEEEEEEEEGEMAPVENLGEKRNKRETKEEKKLRKQQVKEMKSARRQQKKMLKEAFKEEKKLADRKKAVGKSGSTFKM